MQDYEKIRALREDNDITQEEIADYLGIDRSYYGKYERGKHPIPAEIIKRICIYYKVSADYILGLPKGLHWPR